MNPLQGCSDWWVRSTDLPERDPGFLEWLQASVYFLPHVLFRLISLSLIFALTGYYSIPLVALIALLALIPALPVISSLEWDVNRKSDDGIKALLSFVLALLAPISFESRFPSHRHLMKRTITLITSSLLTVLTLIRTLPILVDPETLVTTQGLCHLNFTQLSGASFQSTLNCYYNYRFPAQSKCKRMFLTFETFANIWFPILLILGIYCLLDGQNLIDYFLSLSS